MTLEDDNATFPATCNVPGCVEDQAYAGFEPGACFHHQPPAHFNFGLRQTPEQYRAFSWLVKFACGCSGDATSGCRPNITMRCPTHRTTWFREEAA